MKKEETEHLLAAYASGEISAEDNKSLQKLFAEDPSLKQEANEMAEVWRNLNQPDSDAGERMDAGFYAMLQNEKQQQKPVARVVRINLNWLKSVAACLLAFVIGRYTVTPQTVTQYKTNTVYVERQSAAPVVKTDEAAPALPVVNSIKSKEDQLEIKNDAAELPQQLRSAFASERIAAITLMASNPTITHNDLKVLEMVLNEDPNANVRLTVVNALQPLFARNDVQQLFINTLSRQDNPSIQSTIIDILVDARSKQAVPQMLALLDDKNTAPTTQMRIKDGIESFLN